MMHFTTEHYNRIKLRGGIKVQPIVGSIAETSFEFENLPFSISRKRIEMDQESHIVNICRSRI